MNFILLKEDIIEGFQKASNVLSVKSGAGYLKTIWIKAEENAIKIMATDSVVEFIGRYPAQVTESGLVGVPGKKFFELIRKLPPGEIKFTLDPSTANLIIMQGRRKYRISTNDPSWFQDFNFFPDVEQPVVFEVSFLKSLIDRIIFSIHDAEEKRSTNCLSFSKNNKQEIIACGLNGHQISLVTFKNDSLINLISEHGILISKKNLHELRRWISGEEVMFTLTDERLYFQTSDSRESLSFPDVDFAMPRFSTLMDKFDQVEISTLKVDKFEFSDSLERLEIFNNEKTKSTYIDFSDKEIILNVSGSELGEGSETIKCDFSGTLKSIVVLTRGMINVFSHFESSEITFKFTGSNSPFMITGKDDTDYKVVIMPVMVTEETYYTEEDDY